MKPLITIWIVLSFILLFIAGVKLYNSYLSLKYEVEEQRPLKTIIDKGNLENFEKTLADKETILNKRITELWIGCSYLFLSIVISFYVLFRHKALKKALNKEKKRQSEIEPAYQR